VTVKRAAALALLGLVALSAAALRSCVGCGPALREARIEPAAPAPAGLTPRGPDEYVGVVAARRTAVVAVDFDGRVVELLTGMGERVAAGDPVARLDDAELRQELAAARATAEAAERGSELDLDEARHRLGLERRPGGELPRATPTPAWSAQVAELERRLAATLVTAPIAGVVSSVRVATGDEVAAGAAMLRISDPSELSVRFAVPPEHAARVKAGTRVVLAITGTTVVIPAVVRRVAPEFEPPVRLLLVEAEFADPLTSTALLARLPAQAGAVGRVRLAPDQG
jgi:multidrug efflux pump subunit AcrA (membrane-fusion protein)